MEWMEKSFVDLLPKLLYMLRCRCMLRCLWCSVPHTGHKIYKRHDSLFDRFMISFSTIFYYFVVVDFGCCCTTRFLQILLYNFIRVFFILITCLPSLHNNLMDGLYFLTLLYTQLFAVFQSLCGE